jgi:hypothetical protein
MISRMLWCQERRVSA